MIQITRLFVLMCLLGVASNGWSGDWPMWRYGAGRGGVSPDALPENMSLRWTRSLVPQSPAWPPTQMKLQFDLVPEPVVLGNRIFVPSNTIDALVAYDTATGREAWRFYTDGPVRFAPVAHAGKVYVASDDGFLYALEAQTGELVWKFRGGPANRPILGNRRLISSWPLRGGPVLHEGRLHVTASIWPFMGIFIHAIDPATGEVIWTNSGDGTNYIVHPHGAPSFGTVVPQGHLAAVGDALVVPGGRSMPAVYETVTGKLRHFKYDKKSGGHDVAAVGDFFFAAGAGYELSNGDKGESKRPVVFDDQELIHLDSDRLTAFSAMAERHTREVVDKRGNKVKETSTVRQELYKTQLSDLPGRVIIRAGNRLYVAGSGKVSAYTLPQGGAPVWTGTFTGDAATMLAADDKLFIATSTGTLHAFGVGVGEPVTHDLASQSTAEVGGIWGDLADKVLAQHGSQDGYALALGLGSGKLVEAVIDRSNLFVIIVDSDAKKVDAFRRRMTAQGLYGRRVSARVGDPVTYPFPPYVANLVVSEDPDGAGLLRNPLAMTRVFRPLRPYGGFAALALSETQHAAIKQNLAESMPAQAVLARANGLTTMTRVGALPGSANWTHQYADASQSVVSQDTLVKAPLGLLWFGGPSHADVLPRHGHGPSPQVAGGRLIIEGADMLRAVDVYTGRVLWQTELKGVGDYYNNTSHHPGAGEIGSNYVSLPDRVYVVYGAEILELDAATGKRVRAFKLEAVEGQPAPNWGYLGVSGNTLVATSSPVGVDTKGATSSKPVKVDNADMFKTLVPLGETWRYLAGSDPPAGWMKTEFKDAAWKLGNAGFGYGDEDDRTKLRDMKGRYRRVYLRRVFDGAAAMNAKQFGIQINYDDGFVAYLNGQEVARRSIKGSGAKAKVSGHEASGHEFVEFEGFEKLLKPDRNLLAIVGHNASLDSGDFTLDPAVVYEPDGKRPTTVVQEKSVAVLPGSATWDTLPSTRFASGSRRLVVFDRDTGKKLWHRDAVFNFRHNNIALAGERLYCVDRLTSNRLQGLARRGIRVAGEPELLCLDLRTGQKIWSTDQDVFGTFLNYSAEHDTLLQAGSQYRDRAQDEVGTGMVAYRGSDGEIIWSNHQLKHGGPCLLWKDTVLTNGGGGFALDIRTGKPTGWSYNRNYGCNTALGSQHLLTFRSGAAGFFDLLNDSGTGNIGGFKSSCTANLIPADGVLNAPDYTRTCTCAYQNQTSLALIHMPEAEFWTFGGKARKGRTGVNFAAPGDRRSTDGTLWLDVPSRGGSSAPLKVRFVPEFPTLFRHHASFVEAGELPWVASSGISGIQRIEIETPSDGEYQVRLIFLEPEGQRPDERVFDVSIQGTVVLTRFDVSKAAGGPSRSVVRTFSAHATGGKIVLEFNAKTKLPALISGVELISRDNHVR